MVMVIVDVAQKWLGKEDKPEEEIYLLLLNLKMRDISGRDQKRDFFPLLNYSFLLLFCLCVSSFLL